MPSFQFMLLSVLMKKTKRKAEATKKTIDVLKGTEA
jgi:hypothetical protein